MSKDKTPLALVAELEDIVYGDTGALSVLLGQLRDQLQPEKAERKQWVYLDSEHYDKSLMACGDGFVVESQYHSKLTKEWEDEFGNKSAIVLAKSAKDGRSRMLRTEWAKVEEHLAGMVELPDDLIPLNTQIVGGVEVDRQEYEGGFLTDVSVNGAYHVMMPKGSAMLPKSETLTISRLNLHRLKTGEIEMRAIKFEEEK